MMRWVRGKMGKGGKELWAEATGNSNRSRRDQIDTESGSCALDIANKMGGLILFSLFLFVADCTGDLLRDSVHVTSAAARPNNELWCYKCMAEVPEDKCADLRHNNSALIQKCHNDRRMCMVKRFSFTTSTENSTTALKMWALERNCTKHCEPGCIVIGERTKLYACTSCCATSLCNYGSGSSMFALIDYFVSFMVFVNLMLFHIIHKSM